MVESEKATLTTETFIRDLTALCQNTILLIHDVKDSSARSFDAHAEAVAFSQSVVQCY
jgi:hypothetical protein